MLNANEKNYLINSMEELLDEYDYEYSTNALATILDEWASQKANLIEAFKKHPNYVEGKFMIAFDTDYERKIDTAESVRFSMFIKNALVLVDRSNFPQSIKGRTPNGLMFPSDIYWFMVDLNLYAERILSDDTTEYLNRIFPELHAHKGQKTSRVVNKACQILGIDKVDGYNKAFARYADSLSPMIIKRHTILSINPLDYLTMSFGNSWASCHTIDKENKRCMPNSYEGMYSSGTISYMLDPSSMVLYTVDASYEGNEYWNQPKINRQMFHYGEEKLVQARLYPQDNDGDGEAYTPYRNIVQGIMSTIFDFPNLWTLKNGTGEASRYIISDGTNYKDYCCYSNCNISRIKGSENENKFVVGVRPICIECGYRHQTEDNINCCHSGYRCADCGEWIDEDEVCWVDDEPYCHDCVECCTYCGEYYRGPSTHVHNYGDVCDNCLYHFYYCEDCGDYYRERDGQWIESEDCWVCDDCISENFVTCDECGVLVRDEDSYYDPASHSTLCESCYKETVANEETTSEDEAC